MRSYRSDRLWLGGTVAFTASLLTLAATAAAQEEQRRWSLVVGGVGLGAETSVAASGLAVDSEELDFESDLGVEDEAAALELELAFRPAPRHQLELSYLDVDRSGSLVIEDDLGFGDIVFPGSASLRSTIGTRDLDLLYTYFVAQGGRGELGLTIGIHALEIEAGVDAEARLDLPGLPLEVGLSESVSETFAVPLVGARAGVRIGERWAGSGRLDWTGATVDDVDWEFLEVALRLEFEVSESLALGASYRLLDVEAMRPPDAEAREPEIVRAAYRYDGPGLYLRLRF